MHIVVDKPPLVEIFDPGERPAFLEQILQILDSTKPVLFAWGNVIYNPRGAIIPPELMVHEEVHCKQQADIGGPTTWWERYVHEPGFRLEQEIPAHRAEYLTLKATIKDRNKLVHAQHRLAMRLASPLYGSLIDYEHAMAAIKGGERELGYRESPSLQHQRQRFRPTAD